MLRRGRPIPSRAVAYCGALRFDGLDVEHMSRPRWLLLSDCLLPASGLRQCPPAASLVGCASSLPLHLNLHTALRNLALYQRATGMKTKNSAKATSWVPKQGRPTQAIIENNRKVCQPSEEQSMSPSHKRARSPRAMSEGRSE